MLPMFVGEYSHSVDDKGRVTIPARFREELNGGMTITRGYDPCLVIYPAEGWTALARRVAGLPMASQAARAYSRLIFGGAAEVEADGMGRILVPAFLRQYAGIEDRVTLVGMNTFIEVWEPKRRQETLEQDLSNLDVILADIMELGL
jgi:MraZ protein